MKINTNQVNTFNQLKNKKAGDKCDGCPEQELTPKDSFVGGLKLGLGYTLDPIGTGLEAFEQTFVNGKGLKENTFRSAFMEMAGDVHKDNSLERYLGEGAGLLIGGALQAATGGVIAAATGLFSFGAGLFGIGKTLEAEPAIEAEAKPEGTFKEGFNAGFGVSIDPIGAGMETTESFLLDGKGIHENTIKTVSEDLTVEAHKSRWNLRKTLGAVAGAVSGSICNIATGGLLPLGTFVADVIKTLDE